MGYRKLGRKTDHRNLMLRNLATDVIVYGRITTTETRAKEVSKLVDKLITFAKKGDLNSRREAAKYVMNVTVKGSEQTALQKLFDEVGPAYAERNGGYTRILKTSSRRGDNAPKALIELA
ncbi:MAG: 50S ribosomal protein L17 [Erysipelothrix sp.]|nr:50S ribosomal protein L17 [Erysipelothrix sp.]